MNDIKNKGKFGKFIKLDEYIQIPILRNNKYNKFNENPYILLSNIKDKYLIVKDTAGEEDFWRDVAFKLQQGKINGYQSDNVYETDNEQAIVEVSRNEATHMFWDPFHEFTDDEFDWLDSNTEVYQIYYYGEFVEEMYVMPIRRQDSDNKST